MKFFEIIGNNIQIELDKRNWKQKQLADEMKVSRQVVQKIIKGKKAINAFEISLIAKILSVSTDYLLEQRENVIGRFEPVVQFMGQFSNSKNFEHIKSIIDEFMAMEEDLSAFRARNN